MQKLFQNGRNFTYTRDEAIVHEGDTPSGVYRIRCGYVKTIMLHPDGHSTILSFLGPDDVFPLTWAITGRHQDIAFAAVGETRVQRVSREAFLTYFDDPQARSQELVAMLTHRLDIVDVELISRDLRSAQDKVIYRLLTLGRQFGHREDNTVIFPFALTHETLAGSINVSRETVSRILAAFARQHLIGRKQGRLMLLDAIGLLRKLADEDQRQVAWLDA
jgi:CRP-like cAMP-binding protein